MISDLAVTRNIQSSCDTICPMTLDIKQFEQHLFKPESAFEILLRGHLWIEALIDRCLEVHIVDANALDLERIGFRQKIDIAQAFGFISQEDGHAFRMVNRLRNRGLFRRGRQVCNQFPFSGAPT